MKTKRKQEVSSQKSGSREENARRDEREIKLNFDEKRRGTRSLFADQQVMKVMLSLKVRVSTMIT